MDNKLLKYQNVAIKKGGRLLSTSIHSDKRKLKWQCNEGHIFLMTIYKVHRRGQWCKTCGSSIGERSIRMILKEFNLKFESQFIISLLPTRKYDFYFEYNNNKYLIEFDGLQHFEFVRKYHKTKAKFIESQIIDRIKTYIAWKSGFKIIRIDYMQHENIKSHIITALNSNSLVYFSNPILYKYITDINITGDQLQQYANKFIQFPSS